MKANRKFVEGEEAVSAVIGVILMVAITVAIAATVYYYVTTILPEGGQTTPNIIISQSDEDDYLKVISADSDLDWANVEFITEDATLVTTDCTGTITPGDKIESLSGEISLYWSPSNALIGTWEFT